MLIRARFLRFVVYIYIITQGSSLRPTSSTVAELKLSTRPLTACFCLKSINVKDSIPLFPILFWTKLFEKLILSKKYYSAFDSFWSVISIKNNNNNNNKNTSNAYNVYSVYRICLPRGVTSLCFSRVPLNQRNSLSGHEIWVSI